jgi:peptidoglycan/xylan/chitin deacetylase (PgdA/CDA1 family)
MHSEGHELANHGFHSVLFTDLSFEDIASNVLRTSGIISNVTNSQVKYFRPPKGTVQHDEDVVLSVCLLHTCMHDV